MTIIDAHAHLVGDDDLARQTLSSLDVHCLNICVAPVGQSWESQRTDYAQVAKDHPDHYSWITTFDPPDVTDPHYVDRVKEELDRDFANGAIACKVWKNIGMELRTPDGGYMTVDHPLLAPIFAHLASRDRTLLAHVGEPYACWQPLAFESPHADYYRQNPKWHMHAREGVLSHRQLMDSFDRMLAQHPTLRVVGAHLGSQEYDLGEIAKRLDRFPHYAVDTGARNYDLMFAGRSTVQEFFHTYGDRILFGIDLGLPHSSRQSADKRAARLAEYRHQCTEAFAFYRTDTPMTARGKDTLGLHLGKQAQEKFFSANARRWYQLT